jgi:predicted dehydrogenase
MRIAVLGLGFMGSTHLKALRHIPQATLAAVVSADEKKLTGDLSEIQGNLGGPGEKLDFSGARKYKTVEEALADPEIEAVDICLPTAMHAPVAREALRAGKHVLVEKPMALDAASCDAMIAEAHKAGRILMTAQVLRFFPDYGMAGEIVRSRRLGAVRSAFFRRRCAAPAWSKWLHDAGQSGGGVFDLLIHDVDFAIHLFGRPTEVSALGHENMAGGIDTLVAQLHYPEIGPVTVTGGWHHPKSYPFSMEFTIVSDGGTLEYSSAGRPLVLYGADGGSEALATAGVDGYQAEIEYFIECAAEGRQPAKCPAAESAAAVKITRLLLESRARYGEKIACPL